MKKSPKPNPYRFFFDLLPYFYPLSVSIFFKFSQFHLLILF